MDIYFCLLLVRCQTVCLDSSHPSFWSQWLAFSWIFCHLWLLHLRPLANLGHKSSQFFHIFAFLAIYRCLLQTFYHINQAELEIKGQVYRFSTIITFCPEWPWNWTHTTTTLCASVLLYAWRSLGKMTDMVWQRCMLTIPTVSSVFTLPPSPAQQMLYQSGLTPPGCQSKSNPSFFSLSSSDRFGGNTVSGRVWNPVG